MAAPSTVGRGRVQLDVEPPTSTVYRDESVSLHFGDALDCYPLWPAPTVIISDGAYGILGFDGDTAGHVDIPAWYEPHVAAWSKAAMPSTTLWFWNSEIGWASAHPLLEKHGWKYVNSNVWNKGIGHIAGNVNTAKIRRFPVVTEVCVQYVFEAKIGGRPLKKWLLDEWLRTGLPRRMANEACGVKDAATRKYLDQSHLWYFPPPEVMEKLVSFANERGDADGRPYFSIDGIGPASAAEWSMMRAKFCCPHGVTNVWDLPAVAGAERIKVGGKAVHLNQKPLGLVHRTVEASSDPGDNVWEPFGGLMTGALAAKKTGRFGWAAENVAGYYKLAVDRFVRG